MEESSERVKHPQMLQRHEMLRSKTTTNAPPTSKTDIQNHNSGCDQKTGQGGKSRETKSDSKEYNETGYKQSSARENVPHNGLLLQFTREHGCESP
tara:strand:- start:1678 stop:1965 length:288 start_codon:yes stop_codon:yes gene_type:complete